jgi:uncharacterized repeat protein (TIGR01451 family)
MKDNNMKMSERRNIGPRRAIWLLGSGLLAAMLIFGLAPWTAADDSNPKPGIPDESDLYADRMPTEEEIEQIESPVERYMAREFLFPEQLLGSELGTSSKMADRDEVPAGSSVTYTIRVENSGDAQVSVTMVDALPAGLSYVGHERVEIEGVLPGDPEFEVEGNEVTWYGDIIGGGYAVLEISARVDVTVAPGTILTNVAEISGGEQTVQPSVAIEVLEMVEVPGVFLPITTYGIQPDPPGISDFEATRPNSQNKFSLSWNGGPNASRYVVQQANNPNFNSPIEYDTGLNTFLNLQPEPSWRNDFYFRVRSYEGVIPGEWSETINVVGAYYDEFDDPESGWSIRRTTHLDHVNFWYEIYEDTDWIILEVGDKWDWGIASPLAKAPEVPYVIEFDAKFAQTPNEVAMGFVFSGDYPGDRCPDTSSVEGWYQHDLCFNHFYNPQWYWAGEALHLIWQRVDYVEWCPDCGGSPMKRRGDTENLGQMDDVKNDDWNRHRVEVREGSIKYYAGRPYASELTLQHEYNDTLRIDEPLFGVFAYAGEYTSSVARYENFSITPLDN